MGRRGSTHKQSRKRRRQTVKDAERRIRELEAENARLREELDERFIDLSSEEDSEEDSEAREDPSEAALNAALTMTRNIFPNYGSSVGDFFMGLRQQLSKLTVHTLAKQADFIAWLDNPDGDDHMFNLVFLTSPTFRLIFRLERCESGHVESSIKVLFKDSDSEDVLYRYFESFEAFVGYIMGLNNFSFERMAGSADDAPIWERAFRTFFVGVVRAFAETIARTASEWDASFVTDADVRLHWTVDPTF